MRLEAVNYSLKDCPFIEGKRMGSLGCTHHCEYCDDAKYINDFHGRLINIEFTCKHPNCSEDLIPSGVSIIS